VNYPVDVFLLAVEHIEAILDREAVNGSAGFLLDQIAEKDFLS
jgi:hypothetical protein